MKTKIIIGLLALTLALAAAAQPQQQQTVRLNIRNSSTQQITALDASVSGCAANLTRPTSSLDAGASSAAVVQVPGNCQPQIVLSYQGTSGNNCTVTIKPVFGKQGFGSQSVSSCQATVIPMPGAMANQLGYTVILR